MAWDTRGFVPPPGTTAPEWGELSVERKTYAPLEMVRLHIGPGRTRAQRWRVEWFDGLATRYGRAEGTFHADPTIVEFPAGGAPGMQFVRLWLDDGGDHRRLVNFTLAAETSLVSGDADLDALYPVSREAMLLNRRRYPLPEGIVVGYTTADSVQTLAYWLRDMLYNLPGYRLWERDVAGGFAALLRRQRDDGSLPDGVRADGSTWRMITESDVEYLAMLAVQQTWLITGDEGWLAAHLPIADRALAHWRANPLRWREAERLPVRAHTCDTWDFSIVDGDRYDASTPQVAALCDVTGYYAALSARARIESLRTGGDPLAAARLREEAEAFRIRAAARLWDGEKFQHHLHLDRFDHGRFDEGAQLAMSNTWAITRGFAEWPQALRILDTYRRRWAETGDRFPWWSLQPGYPHADYPFLAAHPYQHTGGYCNGGLMPWVGGALAHGAFLAGAPEFGLRLLRDYAAFCRESGGEVYTWYWPNGEPGFRTANTTGHDGWGMGHWLAALFEGLAGVEVTAPAMREVTISPHWAAGKFTDVRCVTHFPASEVYTAYRWQRYPDGLVLELTGVAERSLVRLLLPEFAHAARVTVDGADGGWETEQRGGARYVRVVVSGPGVHRVAVTLQPTD